MTRHATRRPLVSVLLPCRNAGQTLDEALASIVSQTLGAMEIIVVDDGSTDHTPRIIADWAARDPRVRPFRTPARGIVAALNTASRQARGPYLARMDADDIAETTRLERQVAFLRAHPGLAACGTGVRYFPRRAVRAGARRYEHWINGVVTREQIERDLFVECPIPHPTLVLRRRVFEAVGGYRHVDWPEDYDLILRLWTAGYRLAKLQEILLHWRERPNRLSRTDTRFSADAFRRCKANFLGHRTSGRPIVVWGAGPVGKAFAVALRAARQRVSAFIELDPRKLGQTIHGIPVVPPSGLAGHENAYVIAAVGLPRARADIRHALYHAGYREPEDFCAVA